MASCSASTFRRSLDQDSIWTYEIGAKAELLDRKLTLEGAVYYSDWKDVAVRIPIATTGFNGLINSKGHDHQGRRTQRRASADAGADLDRQRLL